MRRPDALLRAATDRPLLGRLVRPVVVFASVAVGGVVGFVTLAGVGPIEATFWLLDPTSIELHFETHDGPGTLVKGYAIVVLGGLILTGLWTGETAVSAAFGGRIQEELVRMQTRERVQNLDDHVVICGYGTFGKTIAGELEDADQSVVVVERQGEQYEQAIDDGHLALEGDAREPGTLEAAGIEHARTMVGAIDDTNTNVQIAVRATQLEPTVSVVVRAGDQMDEALARRVGADEVVIPEIRSGKQVGETLSRD